MKFDELGLNDSLLEALSYMGFDTATPIQEQIIPEILKGKDVIACAQTGTGKTAAFVLPSLQLTAENTKDVTTTLILSPTRELAIQIEQQIQGLAYFLGVSSMAIYGGGDGQGFTEQKKALTSGTNIIVATPGKLISHLNLGYVKFDTVTHLILDEADRMLDMNFYDDIEKIRKYLPNVKQTSMFSATMSPKIKDLAKKLLNDPVQVILELSKPAEGVLQVAYCCYDPQKAPIILSLIRGRESLESIIIFCATKKKVGELHQELKAAGENVASISSSLEQDKREEVLLDFRAKKIRILVGTDVISRGIDIKDINLVINYTVPKEAEDYVHRVGRTARANTTGIAVTLINQFEMAQFADIEKLIGREVTKSALPEGVGEGPAWNASARGGGRSYDIGGGGKSKSGGKGNYKGKRK